MPLTFWGMYFVYLNDFFCWGGVGVPINMHAAPHAPPRETSPNDYVACILCILLMVVSFNLLRPFVDLTGKWSVNFEICIFSIMLSFGYFSFDMPTSQQIRPKNFGASPPSSWSWRVLEFLPIPSPHNAVTSVTSPIPSDVSASRHPGIRPSDPDLQDLRS